jgi:twitching motility two-component system response regulator PilG
MADSAGAGAAPRSREFAGAPGTASGVDSAGPERPAATKRRPSMGNDTPSRNPLSGTKVMVIDDSNTIRRSAEIFLLQAGCTVILADDGFDALAKIADHQPDLVFVDIMMPRLDGYQTCALIKKNNRFRSTPVVMLSSKDGLFDRARGRMVGSDQYLTKPFTKESLLKAVAAHVRAVAA